MGNLRRLGFFLGEGVFERSGGDFNGREGGVDFPVDVEFGFEESSHGTAVVCFKESVRRAVSKSGKGEVISEGTVGFDEVIGEVVGIGEGVVVESELGDEADGAEVASQSGAKESVAVVEEGVGEVFVMAAEGAVGKEAGPVFPGGSGFGVVGITGADVKGNGVEGFRSGEAIAEKAVGLGFDLGFDDMSPELFFLRKGGFELEVENLALAVVAGPGKGSPDGKMAGVHAEDKGVGFGKGGEDTAGEGGFRGVEDEVGEVFKGKAESAFVFVPEVDFESPVLNGEVSRTREVDATPSHGSGESFAAPGAFFFFDDEFTAKAVGFDFTEEEGAGFCCELQLLLAVIRVG